MELPGDVDPWLVLVTATTLLASEVTVPPAVSPPQFPGPLPLHAALLSLAEVQSDCCNSVSLAIQVIWVVGKGRGISVL